MPIFLVVLVAIATVVGLGATAYSLQQGNKAKQKQQAAVDRLNAQPPPAALDNNFATATALDQIVRAADAQSTADAVTVSQNSTATAQTWLYYVGIGLLLIVGWRMLKKSKLV